MILIEYFKDCYGEKTFIDCITKSRLFVVLDNQLFETENGKLKIVKEDFIVI